MFVVKDRVAVVAGASGDVGEAICRTFVEGKAGVALVGADTDELGALTSRLAADGARVESVVADFSDSGSVKNAVDTVVEKMGTIDILVNNMDFSNGKAIADATVEDFQNALEKNLIPAFVFSSHVIPKMREKKYGRVINLSALQYLGVAGEANYCAAKSGVFGLTRSLALELARERITVNTVVVGDMKPSDAVMSEEELEKASKGVPVQRLGTPADVAYAVGYFASDTSKYVTGQTLFVCGGKSLYSSMSV
jgi:3-oxoacyl-[acyl-carrier protein] reductase/2-[hydroxy(phenyl)methyl]-succinyl-CoA dehydrogenase BbsC subunit